MKDAYIFITFKAILQNLLLTKWAFGFSFINKEPAIKVKNAANKPFLKFYSEFVLDLKPQTNSSEIITNGMYSLTFIFDILKKSIIFYIKDRYSLIKIYIWD